MKTMLFYRDFRQFQGGHLKVWDYFNHVMHSSSYRPQIYFSKETVWDKSNPWFLIKNQVLDSRQSVNPDSLFLAGLDWLTLDNNQRKNSSVPIVNLIQHVRHANPKELLYSFLGHKAIRICVSKEIESAIVQTGKVNGPVFSIPAGIDLQDIPAPIEYSKKSCDILIAALKNPELGCKLAKHLQISGQGFLIRLKNLLFVSSAKQIEVLTRSLLRQDYLKKVNQAKVAVFLPHHTEGCYLPPLEGMALGTLVICPDSIGTAYGITGNNCLRPKYTLEDIIESVKTAWQLSPVQVSQMLDNAKQTVVIHDLVKEQNSFLEILENLTQLW
jgi:hypothetical protein